MNRELVAVKKSERPHRLPDDFVASTMVAIRAARHGRTMRRHALSTASLALVLATVLLGGLRSYRESLAMKDSSSDALREQVMDRAMAYELSQSTAAPAAGDYLLPNTASLMEFASTYSDSSWQYDPDWRWTR